MPNRTEVAAELARLRAEIERIDDIAGEPDPEPAPAPTAQADTDDSPASETDADAVFAELEQLLAPHGVDSAEIAALVEQFRDELEDLPRERPLVALIGAFALGFLVGRLTKRGV